MDRQRMRGYECVPGLDVGKSAHHAWIADPDGKRLWDGPVRQDERELQALCDRALECGRVLLVVDQTGTVGSLPLAVARGMGVDAAYLPGLAMRRYAQMTAGTRQDRPDRREADRRMRAGQSRRAPARERAGKRGRRVAERVFDALDRQPVAIAWDGEDSDRIVKDLARRILDIVRQRAGIEKRMHQIASENEEYRIARTMPGMGVRTTVSLIVAIDTIANFPGAARLASYAGLAPARRQSGTSIRHDHAPRGGNRKLKRSLYLAAGIAAIHDPASRAHHQRKRNEGKHHAQALISLARRRCDTLHSMLRHHTTYQPQHNTPTT